MALELGRFKKALEVSGYDFQTQKKKARPEGLTLMESEARQAESTPVAPLQASTIDVACTFDSCSTSSFAV